MLGMFPGTSMPPETSSPNRAAVIWCRLMAGTISAAVRVALSRTAELMLTQKSACHEIDPTNSSMTGVKPVPRNTRPTTKM